jgi:hypothetical protein
MFQIGSVIVPDDIFGLIGRDRGIQKDVRVGLTPQIVAIVVRVK